MDVSEMKSITPPPVAIISIGCFFPHASGLKAFWHLLYHGKDAIAEVPPTHWSTDDYFDEDPRKADHVYCRRGGFLSPVPFDPTAFGIPPSNLEATDTSQILGLIAAKTALEQAGYGEEAQFDRDQTAVILGVTGTQELVIPLSARLSWPKWKRALDAAGISPEKTDAVISQLSGEYVAWQENSFPGLLGNVVAGRISNRLDLGGTNCVVDAACASSMSAINLALMELYTGRARMVVSGGVDTLNDIFMHMCFARTQILSPSGDARPFSREADGTVLGEGIGILVMKRLADAEADGDQILAVLKGIGSSSDGKSQSIYAPRAEGQLKALRRAYAAAQIPTASVDLIEAHGTGTRVGDKIEVQALKKLFDPSDTSRHCALGSVKSMIGHTKAAAGAAGLIKSVLALHHKVLPPTLKADPPDPELGLDQSPLYLNPQARPWFRRKKSPRRAGVSAFGFGGSNFHVVLEEYGNGKPAVAWDGSIEIIALSASTLEELQAAFHAMRSALVECPPESLPHLARQSRASFESHAAYRLLMVLNREEDTQGPRWDTETVFDDAATAFEDPSAARHTSASFFGSGDRPGRLVFVFPGQGSQYLHMGRDLVTWFPEALAALEAASDRFSEDVALTDFIYPPPFGAERTADDDEALRNTAVAQPAIGALSVAMAKVLQRFGLAPEATCGHSYGELTALYSAGWIDEDTLYALSTLRGRLMADAGGKPGEPNGAMLAVKAPLDKLEGLLVDNALDVVLANRNSPNQGILSGDVENIERAEAACKAQKFRTVRLPVSAAFHSRLVESAREPFAAALQSIAIRPAGIPVYSNTTGAPYPEALDEIRSLLGNHLRNPVNFIGEIEHMYEDGARIFVEVGPKTVLTGLVGAILKGRDFHAFAMDASNGKKFGILDLAHLLCRLAAIGCPINWDEWESPGPPPPHYKMRIPVRGANLCNSRPNSPSPRSETSPPGDAAATVSAPDRRRDADRSKASTPLPGPSQDRANRMMANPTAADAFSGAQPTSVSGSVNTTNHPVLQALHVVQQGLQSLQALQAQTVEAHQKFLDTQQQASRTLQEMMESSRRFAEAALNGWAEPASEPPVALPAAQRPSTTPAPLPGSPYPRPPASPGENLPMPASPTNPGWTATANGGSAHGIAAVGSDGMDPVSQTLLAVVSELTGYPADMLAMDMRIEADLGIDSIKRVEILSRVEEKLPALPPVTPDRMAEFQTLGQVASFLAGTAVTQAPGLAPSASGGGTGSDSRHTATGITTALLTVVSELTGYPTEMLSLDMDVEADLGIDSIKRVEILSALEDRIPDFTAIAPDEMAELKTLGQIANRLRPAVENPEPEHANLVEPSPLGGPGDSPETIRSALMAVVSELTGYPVEMLSTDMDIESDLGIDSIKRVEILSAMEDRLPERPFLAPDEMAELKTLGQIVAAMAGAPPSQALESAPTEPPAGKSPAVISNQTPAPAAPLVRRELTVVEAAYRPARQLALPKDRKVFITTDKAGLSHALADQLSAQGLATVQISMDILKHREQLPEAAGLILLADSEDGSQEASPRLKALLENAFALLHHLGASLQASAQAGGAFLATISRLDGAFGLESMPPGAPHQGGLSGFAKTAAIEWPEVTCRALDVDARWQDNSAIARQVVQELLQPASADAALEVGLGPDRRVAPVLTPAPLDRPQDGALNLDSGDVIVISGGARGVTAVTAEALSRQQVLTLILLGRSPQPFREPEWLKGLTAEADLKRAIIAHEFPSVRPTPPAVEEAFRRYAGNREIQRNLAAIEAHGSTVRYFSVDIRNAEQVRAVLNDVRLVHGPIKALIHGAGVLRDRLITDKTPDEFHQVLSTKVDGLESLLAATGEDPLRYIMIFSSVAARFGNAGQVDYAVANEVLNKMAAAEAARRRDCVVRAINWGPWDGGMVGAHLRKAFKEKGIALIPQAAGAEAFVAEMRTGNRQAVEIVIGSELSSLQAARDERPAPILAAASEGQKRQGLSTTFISELNLDHYPILDHHRLDGKPVVPFALMAEWFGHGALHNHPGLQLAGLDDMRLLKGIVLADRQRPVRVLAAPAKTNGDGIKVDLELRDGHAAGSEVIHSRATAILTDRLPAPPDFTIPSALQKDAYPRDVDQIYKDILFHGSALHGIRRVRACNTHGMRAELGTAPAPAAWILKPPRNRWIADPLVLDGAFQMASLWCYEETGRVSLPSYTAAYRQYRRKFPSAPIQAILLVKDVSRYKLVGDFTFLDQAGKVLAEINGYEAVMEDRLMRAFKPQRYAAGR